MRPNITHWNFKNFLEPFSLFSMKMQTCRHETHQTHRFTFKPQGEKWTVALKKQKEQL